MESIAITEKWYHPLIPWRIEFAGEKQFKVGFLAKPWFFGARMHDVWELTMKFVSDKWFDNSFWVIELSDYWEVTENSGQHIRLKTEHSYALIGVRKHVKNNNGVPVEVDDTYKMVKSAIWSYPLPFPLWKQKPVKTVFKNLIGYTSTNSKKYSRKQWQGYFIYKDWCIYVDLESSLEKFDKDKDELSLVYIHVEKGA